MAEVVSSILELLVEKLASSAVEEIQLLWSFKDDIEKLRNTLKMIQEVLTDAEQKQTKDAVVRCWLSSLKDFCYDVEDVVDEFETRATRALWRQATSTGQLRMVRHLFSWLSNFIFRVKMVCKMKELGKRLDKINEEKNRFNLSRDPYDKTIVSRKETHSFILFSNVIGRKKEKERIIDLLIGSDDGGDERIAVVPVLGMGGTGKTTLAKLVFNDEKVNEHFKNNKVWLFMPVEFEEEKILRGIMRFLSAEACDSWNVEMLQNHVRNLVKNKRWLFVMDDVWALTREEWVGLRDLIGGVSEGSKVIVTSRDKSIASIMGTAPQFDLDGLSPEDSWALFVKCAFDQGQEKNQPDLMAIGEEIVSKCKGNPLALKTLGSLLYSKNNRSDWEYVRNSEMWQLQTKILPSLRISYDLMPPYLKKCFAYCSLFPKDRTFNNWSVIQLWISNGLIQSSGHNQELEEIGLRYWEELQSRSFFEFVDVGLDEPAVLYFRMHDLIRELAISVAQTESSSTEVWGRDISPTVRYISFPNPSRVRKDELRKRLSKLSCVRTLLCEELGSSDSEEFFLETCILRFKLLRALWLQNSSFSQLPSSIGGLKHLRYLCLESGNIKKLPKSIYKLCNLQFLVLGCPNLEELPTDIKNMISLRSLNVITKQRRFLEGGLGCLTSLRWLFIQNCVNLEALFDDIQSLTLLRKLYITQCPKLASLPQGIKNLKALEELVIWGCENVRLPEGESNEPSSMSKLQVLRLGLLSESVSLPRWLEGSAGSLQKIIIGGCPKLSALPEWLQNCSSLRTLVIIECPELSSLPGGIRLIPTLKKLQISDCEKLSSCGED